ncbi:MAG: hypothetical protein A3B53_00160 [Candidatus Levybacteria bacterium RIFCSPLOWO2_01_FULL_42_15]|nr:MAG: hypothetical protein A3B53_00160 [Candidatus Levybacteria bacterium RIFCSPLOWO2_01_FULL_42_15]
MSTEEKRGHIISQEDPNDLLERINNQLPQAAWVKSTHQDSLVLSVWFPYGCNISGRLFPEGPNGRAVRVDMISVSPYLQRKGIGSRLLRSFTRAAVNSGATVLSGEIVGIEGLKTMARVFGKENLWFFAENNCKFDYYEQRFLSGGNFSTRVGVDLTHIDVSSWELAEISPESDIS